MSPRIPLVSVSFCLAALCACERPPAESAPTPRSAPEVPLAEAADPCGLGGCAPKIDSRYFEGVPGAGVRFVSYPAQKASSNPRWGTALNDIEQHLPAQYGTTYRDSDKVTHGHETSHGIHAHLRNNYNDTGRRANAFYVLGDRAALVVEPGIRKSQVAEFIPAGLRGSRFGTYVTGQQDWDDRPLYLWDEWNAYANGGEVAVDLFQAGLWDQGQRDAVAGLLEFTVYALAVGLAVERHDPAYFASNAQFREFLAFNTERTMALYRKGAAMQPFARADDAAYYERLRTGPEGESIRTFAARLFGDAWAAHALFGSPMPAPDDDVPDTPDTPDDPEPPPPDDVPPDVQPDVPEDAEPDAPNDEPEPPTPDDPALDDLPDVPGDDTDADGVPDAVDLCSLSPAGKPVWTDGPWIGCAEGQRKDPIDDGGDDVPDQPDGPDGPDGPDNDPARLDADADGILDAEDICLGTAVGQRVWKRGEWMGCAGGQHANNFPSLGPDADADRVADADDLCRDTPAGRPVWRDGPWRGCAGGQFRD